MMGPVEVAGSEPGDTVECRLLALRTRDWGWNSFPLGVGALPHDFATPYVHCFRFDANRITTEYVKGIRYDLHKHVGLAAPLAETATHWMGIGFGDSLDDALVACPRELIAWLHAASGISEGEAYALCSMAVSFRVTQYAHQTGSAYTSIPPKAVHGLVPKSVFPSELAQRIGSWLRPDGSLAR
jgi:acetamidase/formamidase